MIELNQDYLRGRLGLLYHNIVVIDETNSTNDTIRQSEYYNNKTLLFARYQRAGRGTNKRTFFCEKNKGVYVSCLIDLDQTKHQRSFIPLVMACACAITLESFGFKPALKWVNDVLINHKKVAGILCEKTGSDSLLIVGVGINVYSSKFPEDLKDIATSLQNNTNEVLDINDLAVSLFIKFSELLLIDSKEIIMMYKQYYQDLHKKITLKLNDNLVDGAIFDVAENGALIVQTSEGLIEAISSEQIIKI